jgi:glutamate synthase (NADPH/NADH) small chain
VIDLGVEIRTGITVGADVSFVELERQFDAIFLAVGLGATQSLGIPGEELQGVIDAITFIEHLKTKPYGAFRVPARVLVVGAGNTAVDAATQARRLGAEHVSLVYRRTEDEAPAYDYELDLARRDGVGFHWLTAPTRIVGHGSAVVGLECISMELGAADHSGRRAVHPVAGTEHVIPCDLVIKAVGQSKRAALLSQIPGLTLDAMGRIVVNAEGQTGNAKYFAGGDCSNGGREIVNAAAEGRHAACAIHGFLSGG